MRTVIRWHPSVRRLVLLFVLLLSASALFLIPRVSTAQTFPRVPVRIVANAPRATRTVTNTNDSGVGSLRAAIDSAASGDVIVFAANVSGTITLTTGELLITNSLTLDGPGANVLTLSGNNANRIWHVGIGGAATVSDLTLANGNDAIGGGIYNQGDLTLTNATVIGNTSGDTGGGIQNDGRAMIVTSAILSNTSTTHGGGIATQGTLTLTASTIANNSADSGGGISNSGILFVSGSTLNNNRGGFGGAIRHWGGTLYLVNSTLSGNQATGTTNLDGGGAIDQYNSFESFLINTTIVSNTAVAPNKATSGIWLEEGTMTLKNSLVAFNGDSGTANFKIESVGVFTSTGYNLSNGNIPNALGSDLQNTNPLIGGLANNGGPTWTHALLVNSPAIDALPVANCTDANGVALAYDQRGVTRPQGAQCDIGAYEFVFGARLFLPLVVR